MWYASLFKTLNFALCTPVWRHTQITDWSVNVNTDLSFALIDILGRADYTYFTIIY